ncbi:dihydroxyacetone kinase phosphoryl donor subunit DhaM [Laceyella putida]|uniref:phosphoenolpyruvate--glycerone phosphotransferase n=1 Tax=Laceyella putida TaxID=110101 RepID=A0ABW2RPY7_9BACL
MGIVLVSHSADIVRGLKQFLRQFQPNVPIAVAGGTDEGELGTSAFKIKEAIESVYSDKGVLVLFDLGSALLHAEMALELLAEREGIQFADAPLIEGAYAAVVEAGCGSGLDKVRNSAEKAKQWQKVIRDE